MSVLMTGKINVRQWLLPAFLISFAIKMVLAASIPFSGDEAYFLIWGQRPDFGFYDHPPMVGWLLWLMLRISNAEWVLRLPVVLFTSFVGYGLYRLLRDWDAEKAAWAALLFWVSPINLMGVLITTDTGLILFSFICVWWLSRAMQSGLTKHFIWAGLAFGFAVLSKYFAALLGVAILAYWATTPQARVNSRGFIWFCLATLPAIALNVYWNYGHCWANIMFNVYNRHENAGFAWYKPFFYLALQLYLLTPLAAWLLFKQRHRASELLTDQRFRLFAWVFTVPMLIFALISFEKVIGWHWVLSFYPFMFALLVWWLDVGALRKVLRFMLGYTALHVLAFAVILIMPISAWQHTPYAKGALLMLKPNELLEQLAPFHGKYALATEGYSMAAILTYHAGENVMVFGEGSSHARHDDIVTDFRQLQGRNILVLLKNPPTFEKYGPYFKSIEFSEINFYASKYYLVLGVGFNFEAYRAGVLRRVKDQYYAIPNFLPMGGCYFCERYFPQEACRSKHRP